MIYKICPAVLLLILSFSPSKLFFPETKNVKKAEIAAVIKTTSETNEEIVYNSLKANQFALHHSAIHHFVVVVSAYQIFIKN